MAIDHTLLLLSLKVVFECGLCLNSVLTWKVKCERLKFLWTCSILKTEKQTVMNMFVEQQENALSQCVFSRNIAFMLFPFY